MENRTSVQLKADMPIDIYVDGGINANDIIFHISFPPSAFGKRVTASLKDANGNSISQTVVLNKGNRVSFEFNDETDNPNFGFLELLSTEDLNFELRLEIIVGGFE